LWWRLLDGGAIEPPTGLVEIKMNRSPGGEAVKMTAGCGADCHSVLVSRFIPYSLRHRQTNNHARLSPGIQWRNSVEFRTCEIWCCSYTMTVKQSTLFNYWTRNETERKLCGNCEALIFMPFDLIYARARLTHRPDYGGSKHLWNVDKLLRDYTAQNRRRHSPSYSSPWEPEISPRDCACVNETKRLSKAVQTQHTWRPTVDLQNHFIRHAVVGYTSL
jgi:hypothetical protein